jgi:periplasmic divalent cation tolerance protein
MTDVLHVSVTCATREEAREIAQAIVAERLAACAQVSGPIESTFRWEGEAQTAAEWRLVLKTTRDRFSALEAAVRKLHSYDVPEVIAVPVAMGSEAYLNWVRESVSTD